MFENILEKQNKKVMLLGNEAIVRGALEAGVRFVATYPGTPASEIGNSFYLIQRSHQKIKNLYFEFSVNEKVAIEAGAGASFSGLRTLVAMKNFGLNVASDFLLPLVYTGVKAGMVILVADDPNCWSSAQSEENTRAFAQLAHIPILEPSTPQECKDFTKFAFEMSEKFKIPVMVRETTRVAHQSAPVKLSKINIPATKGKFVKDTHQFVTMPPRVLEMHKELLEKLEKIRQFCEKSKLNLVNGSPSSDKSGIITSGASYLYVMEALGKLSIDLPVFKLGFFYPLPQNKLNNFIKNLDKVLIVEELEPCLEKEVNILAKDINPKLKVFGKDLLPEVGELKPEIVLRAIAKFTGKLTVGGSTSDSYKKPSISISRRPQLCPGCPYWLVFGAVKKAVNEKKVIFGGGIGCYMLAGLPPHNIQDYLYCMGSSIGLAHGIKKSSNQKLITFIGDSSFYHAGIPALINTVFNQSNPLVIIMNNDITAMTGHQPHPGVEDGAPIVKIEDLVKACGVKNLKIIDPVNQKEFIKTVKDFVNKKEVSVIIARRPCVFVKKH
ncbi:indolepyruvate ferredoxin oxidoreductase subunit alpha [Candidatus Parcubacteria bacterium]|nr:indolepyruvate ferredoxin oxidoreductase subunit alpha [Candidatus Parcubacteria bacterium]